MGPGADPAGGEGGAQEGAWRGMELHFFYTQLGKGGVLMAPLDLPLNRASRK